MTFIRVRSASGAAHEFDAPATEVEQRPELYVVIDPEPVDIPRPVRYVIPAPAKAARKTATKPPARKTRAQSAKEN